MFESDIFLNNRTKVSEGEGGWVGGWVGKREGEREREMGGGGGWPVNLCWGFTLENLKMVESHVLFLVRYWKESRANWCARNKKTKERGKL